MKIRNGFVSNSSSSCFLVEVRDLTHLDKIAQETKTSLDWPQDDDCSMHNVARLCKWQEDKCKTCDERYRCRTEDPSEDARTLVFKYFSTESYSTLVDRYYRTCGRTPYSYKDPQFWEKATEWAFGELDKLVDKFIENCDANYLLWISISDEASDPNITHSILRRLAKFYRTEAR